MLEMFSGQITYTELKSLTFGELYLLREARKQRLDARNNSKESKQARAALNNMAKPRR